MRSRTLSRLRLAAWTLIAVGTMAGPVLAEEAYRVSTLRYNNDGAYNARPVLVYLKPDNTTCRIARSEWLGAGATADYQLGAKNKGWDTRADCTTTIPDQAEVWFEIVISQRDAFNHTNTCHKNTAHYYYNANGGTIRYRSKGAVYTENRCRINDKPGDQHKINPAPAHAAHSN